MKYHLRKLSSQKIEEIPYHGLDKILPDKNYWLEIQTDSSTEVSSFLHEYNFDQNLITRAEDPASNSKVNIYGDSLLITLVVARSEDMYQSEYLTLIIKSNVMISILDKQSTLFDDLKQDAKSDLYTLELNLNHLLYYMIGEILQQGLENLAHSRQRIKKLSKRVDDETDTVPLTDIILCKREIGQLTDIVEDQFNMLGFVPKINWQEKAKNVRAELLEQVQGLEQLKKSFERLEEKADAIHGHYQLILQEKGNKKLNTLTVVQSIFVPLTFLAGVYGMNFIFLPELKWKYGYFIVLALMLFITIIQLWWFKRKGWFDR